MSSLNVWEPRDPDELARAVVTLLAALELDSLDVSSITIDAHPFQVTAEVRAGNGVVTVSWPFTGPIQ